MLEGGRSCSSWIVEYFFLQNIKEIFVDIHVQEEPRAGVPWNWIFMTLESWKLLDSDHM